MHVIAPLCSECQCKQSSHPHARHSQTRKDTLDQMAEFDAQLKRVLDGDMTLVSELGQGE